MIRTDGTPTIANPPSKLGTGYHWSDPDTRLTDAELAAARVALRRVLRGGIIDPEGREYFESALAKLEQVESVEAHEAWRRKMENAALAQLSGNSY